MLADLKWYFKIWWEAIIRPIYFYTYMPKGEWFEKPLTVFLISSWLFALAATVTVFVTFFWGIGVNLVEGIAGVKFIIILPVLVVLAAAFFLMIFFIAGAAISAVFMVLFSLISVLLHYGAILLGGKGEFNGVVRTTLYSGIVLLFAILVLIFALLTKWRVFTWENFQVGTNLVYYFTLLYAYGLWSIGVRKVYKIARWQCFVVALGPVFFMFLINLVFNWKIISRLRPFIGV